MKKTFLWICVLLSLVLLFAACDEDDIPQSPVDSGEHTTVDSSGQNTTSDPGSETEQHVHAFGDWTPAKQPTCTEQGEQQRACECGETETQSIDALGHSYAEEITTAPTCTEKGTKTFTCSACNDTYTEEVDSLGHTETIDAAIAPTCTETGLTEGKHCSVCNEVSVAQETVDAIGHSYAEEITTAPTCTEKGTKTFTCSACNDTYTEEIDALGHTEAIDTAIAPTCTVTGLTEGKHCLVCNEILLAQETVDALGHTEVIDAAVAPTCTETGLTEGTHCEVCGEVFIAQETIDALGHTEVIDEAIEPTCTEAGWTEGKHCSVCNEVLVAQETVDALGHAEGEWSLVSQATKTDDGLRSKACTLCGATTSEEIIPAIGSLGLEYSINEDGETCVITGVGSCTDSELHIGAYIDGYRVVGVVIISYNAPVEKLYIHEGIEYIGDNAFSYITLYELHLPESLVRVGNWAFEGTYLTELHIPASVTVIGEAAFTSIRTLEKLTVAEENSIYHSIDNCLVETATSTLIARSKNSPIPEGVTRLGPRVFAGLDEGESFIIPEGITHIGAQAFSYSNITSISLPNSLVSIGYSAFDGCKLKEISLPQGLTSIEGLAFRYCEFTQIEIPSGVNYIAQEAFSGCDYLKTITVSPDNSNYHTNGNCLIETATGTMLWGCAESVIPEEVKRIATFSYYTVNDLTAIVIPGTVEMVDIFAFWFCPNLTEITLEEGVLELSAFVMGCDNLSRIVIPKSVTLIQMYALDNLQQSCEIVYNGTIEEWTNLTSVSEPWSMDIPRTIHCSDGDLTVNSSAN